MMRGAVVCSLLLVLGHFIFFCSAAQRWWSLAFDSCATNSRNCTNCATTNVFDNSQEDMCSRHGEIEMVRAMAEGVLDSLRQCQSNFKDTQWNCTTFNGEHLFGQFTECGTRETAMINALLTAGATLGIAKACHKGVIDECPCVAGQSLREGGITYLYQCNDNIEFSIEYMKNFYGIEDSKEEMDMVNKWNYNLGYEEIHNLTTYCRCTGLSGSCVVQTCYERAPEMQHIAFKLRNKYDGSQRVKPINGTLRLAGNSNIEPIEGFPVHLCNTPNLCNPSPNDNILGTRGRDCNPNSSGSDSCSALCCNNGFESYTYEVQNEKCKFVWCCRIECTQLEPTVETGYRCL